MSSLPKFDALWNYSDPFGTETRFRELLLLARSSVDEAYRLELLTQIARAQGLQGSFDAAHSTLDEVERALRDNDGVDRAVVRLRYLLERGRAFNSAGQALRALPLFAEAAELAERIPHWRYAIDAVHMIALAEPDPAAQVEWNRRGIQMVLDHPDERGWLYALYNNLGETYLKLHRYDDALACFRNLVALDVERGREPDVYATKDVARCLRLLAQTTEALDTIARVHDKLQGAGRPDGWISEEYAECLLACGRADEARPHFQAALDLLSEDAWVVRHDPAKIEHLQSRLR